MSYRLLSYAAGKGSRAGILVGDRVYDAGPSVLALLADWPKAKSALAKLAKKPRGKATPLKRAKLLAPVLYPGNIYCAGAKIGRAHV